MYIGTFCCVLRGSVMCRGTLFDILTCMQGGIHWEMGFYRWVECMVEAT